MTTQETITQLIIRRPSHLATHYSNKYHTFISFDCEGVVYGWCSVNESWIELKEANDLQLIELDESKALTESQTIFLQQAKQTLDEMFSRRGLDFDKQSRAIKRQAYEQQFINMSERYTDAQFNHMYPNLDLFELNAFIKATV